jgi:hypothetical protein
VVRKALKLIGKPALDNYYRWGSGVIASINKDLEPI